MIWNKFIEHYCECYDLDLTPELNGRRLGGNRLIEIRLLTYILRIYFNVSYTDVCRILGIYKSSAQKFYTDVLSTPVYREEAKGRYMRCLEHLKELTRQSA